MKLLWIAALLAVSLPAAASSQVDKCVDKKIDALRSTKEAKQYEAQMGYEVMVTQPMIDEFEMQCREALESAKKKSKAK